MKHRCGWEILYKCTANSEGASQVTKFLWGSSKPQVCPRPANCKTANCQQTLPHPIMHSTADYSSWFCPKNAQFFLQLGLFEVGSHSHHKRTVPGFVWKRTETTSSRRSRYACLVRFWCAPECDCCILTCPNKPHQEGKQTLVRFKRTKWSRSLSVTFGQFNVSLLNKSIHFFRENLSPKLLAYGCCLIRQHVIECRH